MTSQLMFRSGETNRSFVRAHSVALVSFGLGFVYIEVRCCARLACWRQRHLPVSQTALGEQSAAELAATVAADVAARAAQSDEARVVAQLDFVDRSNAVERHEVLEATHRHMPSFAPTVDWTYRSPSHFCFGSDKIESSHGVQQGDPMGPWPFSLVLQRAVSRIRVRVATECPGTLDTLVFYFDERLIAGTDEVGAWLTKAL